MNESNKTYIDPQQDGVRSNADFLTVGPLGSEGRYVTIHRTPDGGHIVHAGCWHGTLDELRARIREGNHGWSDDNATQHSEEYLAFIAMAREWMLIHDWQKADEPTFKPGDRVRLISGGGEHPLYGYKDGEVYTVSKLQSDYEDRIAIEGGRSRHGYARPDQMEKIPDEFHVVERNGKTFLYYGTTKIIKAIWPCTARMMAEGFSQQFGKGYRWYTRGNWVIADEGQAYQMASPQRAAKVARRLNQLEVIR